MTDPNQHSAPLFKHGVAALAPEAQVEWVKRRAEDLVARVAELEEQYERLTQRPEWVTCDYQPEKREDDPGGRSCTEAMNFYANELSGLKEQLEAAQREIDNLNGRIELRAEEDSIYRVYDDEVERRQRAVDALRGMLDCVDRHDEWCGHNKDAPGNGIINRAPEKARAVLERELAERILADKASPPQALLAAHRFVYWGDPEKLRALMAEASSPAKERS